MRFIGLLIGLAGCPWIAGSKYHDDIRDVDGDGGIDERFGGPDCRPDDATIADCDLDGDGYRSLGGGGDDCDDGAPAVHPGAEERCDGFDNDCDGSIDTDATNRQPFYEDADGDGYGAGDPVLACTALEGFATNDEDCNDDNALIRPGAQEFCDGIDRDCDGDGYDPDANDAAQRFVDGDGDGQGSAAASVGCALPGFSFGSGDCNDADPSVYDGAPEVPYDGIDQACDGVDGEFDADGDGYEARAPDNDCDDTNAGIHPGASEACDGTDTDCDGLPDTLDPDVLALGPLPQWFQDADGDGSGDPAVSFAACPGDEPVGTVRNDDDCNDLSDAVLPTADERCDGTDNDCDGQIDEGAIDATVRFADLDGDGHGTPNVPMLSCASAPGTSALNDDCNDADANAYPGAPEVCGDGELQNCSEPAQLTDCDQDGEAGIAFGGTDCDDTRASIAAHAHELCDGIDNDCDLLVDGDDEDTFGLTATVFVDSDGDGYGTGVSTVSSSCDLAPGEAGIGGDCNDLDSLVFPGAPERCNGDDDDCDGQVDENAGTALAWYPDADFDGLGDAAATPVTACTAPVGRVGNDLDCDDGNPLVGRHYDDNDGDGAGNPLVVAQDCALGVPNRDDCNDGDPTLHPGTLWYVAISLEDRDHDGSYSDQAVAFAGCTPPGPSGWRQDVDVPGSVDDCDDEDPAVNKGVLVDGCNGVDDDCDDVYDEDAPDPTLRLEGFLDLDGDGFGGPMHAVACNTFMASDDCDDADPETNPAAMERCDQLDNDCDGEVDEDVLLYVDVDNDGYGGAEAPQGATCANPGGAVDLGGDCDDFDTAFNPGSIDGCGDGLDQDCDGIHDNHLDQDQWLRFHLDRDRDGFGDMDDQPGVLSCQDPGIGFQANDFDCDDHNQDYWFEIGYRDEDLDGYGGAMEEYCGTLPAGLTNLDCADVDDHDPERGWERDLEADLGSTWGQIPQQCRSNVKLRVSTSISSNTPLLIDSGERLVVEGPQPLLLDPSTTIFVQGGELELRNLPVEGGAVVQTAGSTRLTQVVWTSFDAVEFPVVQIDAGTLDATFSKLTGEQALGVAGIAMLETVTLEGAVWIEGTLVASDLRLALGSLECDGDIEVDGLELGAPSHVTVQGGTVDLRRVSRIPGGGFGHGFGVEVLVAGGTTHIRDTELNEVPGDPFRFIQQAGILTFERVLLERPVLVGTMSFTDSTIGQPDDALAVLNLNGSILAGGLPGCMVSNQGNSAVYCNGGDLQTISDALFRWRPWFPGPLDLRLRDQASATQGYRPTDGYDQDSDGSGLPDGWEQRWLPPGHRTDGSDPDGDGIPSGVELMIGTLPDAIDSDVDTRLDGAEQLHGCALDPNPACQ